MWWNLRNDGKLHRDHFVMLQPVLSTADFGKQGFQSLDSPFAMLIQHYEVLPENFQVKYEPWQIEIKAYRQLQIFGLFIGDRFL